MRSHMVAFILIAGVTGAGPVTAGPASDGSSNSGSASFAPRPVTPAPSGSGAAAGSGPAAHIDTVPTRNANVYNGTAHEPGAGPTTQREISAGVAGSTATQQRENDTVEQLDRQVQHNASQQPRGLQGNVPPM
jgi:hypothetical protein